MFKYSNRRDSSGSPSLCEDGRIVLKCSPASSWIKNRSDDFTQNRIMSVGGEKRKEKTMWNAACFNYNPKRVTEEVFHLNLLKKSPLAFPAQKGFNWKPNRQRWEECPSKMELKSSIRWKTKRNRISFPAVHKNRIPRTKYTNVLDWYLHPNSSERQYWKAEMKQKTVSRVKGFHIRQRFDFPSVLERRFFCFPANTDKTASPYLSFKQFK